MSLMDLDKYDILIEKTYFKSLGKVAKVVGLTIEALGPESKLNDVCSIYPKDSSEEPVMAEVVGFKDKRILLMPFGNMEGVGPGCIVENLGHRM